MWFYWHFLKKLLHIYLDSAHLKRNYVQLQNSMHIINEISDLKVTFSVKTQLFQFYLGFPIFYYC